MLGKLIKHEFKATYANYLFIYVAIILLTLINKVFWIINIDNVIINAVRGFITVIYMIIIFASFVVTIIFIIQRFYKNLLKEEGYLSFTLPVGVGQHIISKLIVSFIWSVLTIIAVILSLIIMALNTGFISEISNNWRGLMLLIDIYGLEGNVVLIIILVISSLLYMILMFYASMSLGQLFSKYKILGSVVCFFGLYVLSQVVSFTMFVLNMFGNYNLIMSLENEVMNPQMAIELFGLFSKIFLTAIIFQIIFIAIYYLITYFTLNKRLNLE